MILKTYHLELITPCFCAGADQSHAEIRASSVRGQLRWWFRVLGASPAEESSVFGSVREEASSSALRIATRITEKGQPWNPPKVNPNDAISYVYYFASVSGKNPGRKGNGPRWNKDGSVPPGTKFEIKIFQHRKILDNIKEKLELSINAFLLLGGIGLRVTRGLGSFSCDEYRFVEENFQAVKSSLERSGFVFRKIPCNGKFDGVLRESGRILKEDFRSHKSLKSDKPTPLGTSQLTKDVRHPEEVRQTSAVYFRPVLNNDGYCDLVIFEAPHERVLAERCRLRKTLLSSQ